MLEDNLSRANGYHLIHTTPYNITALAYLVDIFLVVYFACLNQQQRIISSLLQLHHNVLEELGDLGEDGVCKLTKSNVHNKKKKRKKKRRP